MLKAIIFPLALAFWASQSSGQSLEASITRSQVVFGETFELIVKEDSKAGQQKINELDIVPLEKDFELLKITAEDVGARTEHWITLLPKRLGELDIPGLRTASGSMMSNSLTIAVVSANQTGSSSAEELILELSVDKETLHVGEELELTLRLLFTIKGISSIEFTSIEIENAEVGQSRYVDQYAEDINGTRYGVNEIKHIIVPNQSGMMVIPDILFRGQVVSAGSFAAPDVRNDEKVSAFARGLTVNVIDRPETNPF